MFDNIYITDELSVNAEYNVKIENTVHIAETIAKIAILHASLSQNLDVSDIIAEVSQLPSGKISISFRVRTTNIIFNIQ